jgi:hypothetical protein
MLSIEDSIALSPSTEEEVAAIAGHEPLPMWCQKAPFGCNNETAAYHRIADLVSRS